MSPGKDHHPLEFLIIPVEFSSSPRIFDNPLQIFVFTDKFSFSPKKNHFHRLFLTIPVEFSISPRNFHFHRKIFIVTAKFSSFPEFLFTFHGSHINFWTTGDSVGILLKDPVSGIAAMHISFFHALIFIGTEDLSYSQFSPFYYISYLPMV